MTTQRSSAKAKRPVIGVTGTQPCVHARACVRAQSPRDLGLAPVTALLAPTRYCAMRKPGKNAATGRFAADLGVGARVADPFGRDSLPAQSEIWIREELAAMRRLLEQVDQRLVEIAAAGSRSSTKSGLSRVDREALARLAPAIHSCLLGANFVARELVLHASNDSQLKSAIDAAVVVRGKSSTRRLGRLLARGEGVAIEGYVVERLGQTRSGVLWVVKRG